MPIKILVQYNFFVVVAEIQLRGHSFSALELRIGAWLGAVNWSLKVDGDSGDISNMETIEFPDRLAVGLLETEESRMTPRILV